MATHAVAAAQKAFTEVTGVVVAAGRMQRTVTVRVGGLEWNNQVQKYFKKPETHLVHDPNDSLRTGDVVSIMPGWRTSRHKRYVVTKILAPAQVPVEARPPVPTPEERWMAALTKRLAKDERREAMLTAAAEGAKNSYELKERLEKLRLLSERRKEAAGVLAEKLEALRREAELAEGKAEAEAEPAAQAVEEKAEVAEGKALNQ